MEATAKAALGGWDMWLREFTQKGRRYRYLLRSVREGPRVRQVRVASVRGMCGLLDPAAGRYLFFRPLECGKAHCRRCPLASDPHPETDDQKREPLASRLAGLSRYQRPEWKPPCYRRRGAIRPREASAWRVSGDGRR